MADEKKGITVKIDADLHAEIREYLERHEGMTMAEFITLAVDDELHPKIQQTSVSAMRMPSTHRTRVLCIVCFMRNPFEIFSPFYHARAGFSMPSQKFNFYMTPKRP